jgi:serine/threonine protein phosphatase PrpC
MNIKVEKILFRGSGKMNEDTVLQQENLFGVFDGAGALATDGDKLYKGKTSALVASELVNRTFADLDGKKTELKQILLEANNRLNDVMRHSGVDTSDKLNRWATTAAVIRLRDQAFDWVQISDSLIIVIYKSGEYRLLGPNNYDHDVGALMQWQLVTDKSKTSPYVAVRDSLVSARRQANITYSVANGEPQLEHLINAGTESLADVSDIIIFSDGLFLPNPNHGQADDWDTWVSLYKQGGLSLVLETILKIENDDPYMEKYPRFKKIDDKAAVAIKF